MTTIRVQRLDGDRFGAGVSSCVSCRGCDHLSRSNVTLADVTGDRADLTLSGRALSTILLNSWLLPLTVMMAVAMTCSFFGIAEAFSVALSVLGFVIGLAGCKTQSAELIEINEVPKEAI